MRQPQGQTPGRGSPRSRGQSPPASDPRPARTGLKGPWSHGSQESLAFARTVSTFGTDAGKRVAFVLIDNAVEAALKGYFSLPTRARGGSRVEITDRTDFGDLFRAFQETFPDGLPGVDINSLTHWHGIRNTLYHRGNGITADEVQVPAYFDAAVALASALFGIDMASLGSLAVAAQTPLPRRNVPLPEALRNAADRIARRGDHWPDAPDAVVVGVDVWDLLQEGAENVDEALSYMAGVAGAEWVNERGASWTFRVFELDEDAQPDAVIELCNELAEELELVD